MNTPNQNDARPSGQDAAGSAQKVLTPEAIDKALGASRSIPVSFDPFRSFVERNFRRQGLRLISIAEAEREDLTVAERTETDDDLLPPENAMVRKETYGEVAYVQCGRRVVIVLNASYKEGDKLKIRRLKSRLGVGKVV